MGEPDVGHGQGESGCHRDRDDFCGQGIRWAIRKDQQPLIASGHIPNGGSARVRSDSYHVDAGSRIDLRVGQGVDDPRCDSTQVRLRIYLTPDA